MSVHKQLQKEILSMVTRDQAVRKSQYKQIIRGLDKVKTKRLAKELLVVDKAHTNKLKKIVKKYGWPGKSLVGRKASHGAWLLAQHADHDLRFQKKCLDLMKKSAKSDEVDKRDLAHLIDRVRVHEEKPQIYGTQFKTLKNGTVRSFPIYNRKDLDKRRKIMELPSFSEEAKKIKALYQSK